MAHVFFTVTRDLSLPADVVFTELIDWKGHAAWVPLTRVEVMVDRVPNSWPRRASVHWHCLTACGSMNSTHPR